MTDETSTDTTEAEPADDFLTRARAVRARLLERVNDLAETTDDLADAAAALRAVAQIVTAGEAIERGGTNAEGGGVVIGYPPRGPVVYLPPESDD